MDDEQKKASPDGLAFLELLPRFEPGTSSLPKANGLGKHRKKFRKMKNDFHTIGLCSIKIFVRLNIIMNLYDYKLTFNVV